MPCGAQVHGLHSALHFFPPEDCAEAMGVQRKKGVLRYLEGTGACYWRYFALLIGDEKLFSGIGGTIFL